MFCRPRVHYAFETSSKKDVYDDSGFDNNGVVYGNVNNIRRGKCGKAAKFKNGYIYLRKFRKTKTSGSDAILVTFWIKVINPRSTTSIFRGYYKGMLHCNKMCVNQRLLLYVARKNESKSKNSSCVCDITL